MESDSLIGGGGDERAPMTKTGYDAVPTRPATVPGAGPKFTRKTVFGDVRNWKRFSWLEWTFVVFASLTILIVLGMSVERFVSFEMEFENITVEENVTGNLTQEPYLCDHWTCTNDFIFTVVLVLNIVFSTLYVIHGLLQERMFSLVAYAATILIIMFYVIVNYWAKSETKARFQPLRLIRLVLVLVVGPINIVLSSIVSYRMGFFIFTTVGANTSLIRAYKIRSFLLILQIMLLQAMANVLTLSWARDGHFLSLAEKIIVCVLLLFCVMVIILGWTTVMFENSWLVPLWYFVLVPFYAYFVYKIVNVSVDFKADYATKVMMTNNDDTMDDTFIYIGSALIVAYVLGLIVLALMYVFMALTYKNFRKGLKDKAPPPTDQWKDILFWGHFPSGINKPPSTN